MSYKCVFFDLDHTLWDYETNSEETLQELFHSFSLHEKGVSSVDLFCSRFKETNLRLWDLYDRDLITSDIIRNERFKQILQPFGEFHQEFLVTLSEEYLKICPRKGNLIPDALETLEYLSTKYNLTIITNGFEEIQHIKLSSGKVDHFFDHIITSQKAGFKKPSKEIFEYALQLHNIKPHETIMIGDNLMTDILGARNAAIEAVYFNPFAVAHTSELVSYEIKSLKDLCTIL